MIITDQMADQIVHKLYELDYKPVSVHKIGKFIEGISFDCSPILIADREKEIKSYFPGFCVYGISNLGCIFITHHKTQNNESKINSSILLHDERPKMG